MRKLSDWRIGAHPLTVPGSALTTKSQNNGASWGANKLACEEMEEARQ
jgi:hypothetical protein